MYLKSAHIEYVHLTLFIIYATLACEFRITNHSLFGLREEEEAQTVYPLSFIWKFHIAAGMLKGR